MFQPASAIFRCCACVSPFVAVRRMTADMTTRRIYSPLKPAWRANIRVAVRYRTLRTDAARRRLTNTPHRTYLTWHFHLLPPPRAY